MTGGLELSEVGQTRYRRWRDAQPALSEDVGLVLEVLVAIAEDGWPPTVIRDGRRVTRWAYAADPGRAGQWIVARTDDLWVVVYPDLDSFEFITAVHPDDQQRAVIPEWLVEP